MSGKTPRPIPWLLLPLLLAGVGNGLAAELWREPTTGMELVRLPAGCFSMGDGFGDGEHNERPLHEVCLDTFWIGRHEVTQGQWQALMGDNPSAYPGQRYPVEQVRLDEIEEFIRRLNQLGQGTFRLPSEAEWEYACRSAGQGHRFATIDGHFSPSGVNTDAEDDPWPETAPVDELAANALGIQGMSGNLWEWVADIYAADAYSKHSRDNPLYSQQGPSRVVRGGAWSHAPHFARCSKRHMHCRPTVRYDIIGFRLVREP
ncbi:MAG: formylglycine-generating enzyme family protein [Gammaproteobacteria bacterium SHHR-1]|uniref:formylglycine-generating enzyme family protein n=1 Tax=Magnetovirga frankeli TaxID=947516 RepID=UPI001292D6C5|nr:SUMF1/EgtB/PvdO family nonheme iron enzyme [gamma proteobacterium SS-5]